MGSWRAGSFDLLSLSVSPFSARTELRCLRVFFALFTLSIWLPFSLKCVSCVAEISPNVLQDNHRTLQSGCPDVFTVQVKQNTVKSFWQVHCGVLMYARVRVLLILAKSTVQYSVTICTTVTTYSIIIPDFLAWIIWICSIWIDRMYLFFICIYLNQ